jgi:uncharacterized protein
MQYKSLGKTGITVSVLGFGAMRLPKLPDGTCDFEQSTPMLRRALDLGVSYIDSAHGYINGTSEVAVGKAIKGYDRSKLCIATKLGCNDAETSTGGAWQMRFDLSMKRLDTPYIDCMHFHALSWDSFSRLISQPGGGLEPALKARAAGLVHHLSFSCHDTVENIKKLIDTGLFSSMLVQYNYLDRHNEPAIAYAAEKGMGVVVMGPVAGGRLAMPRSFTNADRLQINAPELALRFVWNNPNVTVALSGMNEMAQVEENVASANRAQSMSVEETEQISTLFAENQKLADLYCTGCGYCMPCPNGVNIPENLRYMNWYRVWGLEADAKKAYANLGSDKAWGQWIGRIEGKKADACELCGDCEPKCPQNIAIINQLKEVADTLAS